MFHLEFQNNDQQPDEARDMFNKVSKSNAEGAKPETEEPYVPESQTIKGMQRKESKPSIGETSPEKEMSETNNNKLHKTSSYVNKEGKKNQSDKAKDDTDTSQTKSMKSDKVDEVHKSNKVGNMAIYQGHL